MSSHLHYHWPPRAATPDIEEGEIMDSDASPLDNLKKDVEPSLPTIERNGLHSKSKGEGKGKGRPEEEGDGHSGDVNPDAWLEDPAKVAALRDLKTIALGNARLLYGSDRNRYHDIVTTHVPPDKNATEPDPYRRIPRASPGSSASDSGCASGSGSATPQCRSTRFIYAAYLIITVDGKTKALRKEIANCPLAATRKIVAGLSRDTGVLFTKYSLGDRFTGQQGITTPFGKFELFDDRTAANSFVYDDDTRDMDRMYWDIPRGPRCADRGVDRAYDKERGSKRERLSY